MKFDDAFILFSFFIFSIISNVYGMATTLTKKAHRVP